MFVGVYECVPASLTALGIQPPMADMIHSSILCTVHTCIGCKTQSMPPLNDLGVRVCLRSSNAPVLAPGEL